MFKFLNLLSLLIFTINLQANDNNPTTLAQAEKWLSTANEKGFLENQGQMMDNEGKPVPQVLFKTEAPDLNIWVTKSGLTIQTLRLRKEPVPESELSEFEKEEVKRTGKAKTKKYFDWERVDIDLKGATIKKENILKENPFQGHNNYFYPTCPDGIYGVKEYEKITIKDVYPGIDWVLYRNEDKGFKYDFIVHSGADYQQIELIYKSKTPININDQGELEMFTIYGKVKENKPVSFYENQEIATRFTQNYQKTTEISGDNGYETSISFSLNSSLNTHHSTLIIDPQLTWATFYGGNGLDGPMSIDTDPSGNVFVVGYTDSPNFPVQNAGTFFQGINAGSDAFILKFDNLGIRLWATYYGGNGNDWNYSIATDASGNVFVTGFTQSTNFPVQNAGTFFQGTFGGGFDAFILKFDNAGTRLWATYYGGSGDDWIWTIATDASSNVFVTGFTQSTNFPVQNAGTFFQGTNAGLTDAFILKFNNSGTRLWATYYGGSVEDRGLSLVIDNSGNVFVTGSTKSTNFPVQNVGTFFQGTNAGGNDAFILKFNNFGTRLWATYYGGSGNEYTSIATHDNIAIDNCGNVYVSFETTTTGFPYLQNSCDAGYYDNTYNGGRDILISLFTNTGILLWCTYWGGDGDDFREPLALDTNNNLFVSGEWIAVTNSATYPITNPGGGTYYDSTFNGSDDGFMVKFCSNVCICSPYNGCSVCSPTNSITSPTICMGDSLFAEGNWQTITGSYYDTLVNACGNDSIITTNLTVNPTATGTDVQTACNSFTWIDGNNYNSSTSTPTFTIVGGAANGCDSVVTLNLTINNSTTSNDVQTACKTYTWMDGNTYFSSTSLPTLTLTNTLGCDSIITLNLTIVTPVTTTQTFTECQGFSVAVGSNTYTTTGVFTDVINGCDTMITNLTINDAPQFTLIKEDDNCSEHIGSVLVNVTSSIPPVTYIWNTGSSDSIISNLPVGTYTVTINDGSGCSNANTINVLDLKLDCESFIFIPSVFTPNGDGQNDEFIIQLKGLEFISLEIYNRWGTKLFESTQKNRGWDGRTETDTKATDGTYFFIVSYKTTDGEIMIKKGTLTLLR